MNLYHHLTFREKLQARMDASVRAARIARLRGYPRRTRRVNRAVEHAKGFAIAVERWSIVYARVFMPPNCLN